jgi:hypothetical protein
MLDMTQAGANLIEVEGKIYRFFRSFAEIEGAAAVVFSST